MICVPVIGPSQQEVLEQVEEAKSRADLIELRLDYFNPLDNEAIAEVIQKHRQSIVLTLRHQNHGGKYLGSPEDQSDLLRPFLALQPAYIDLESDTSLEFIQEIFQKYSKTSVILSHHDFSAATPNFDALFARFKRFPKAHFKLAVMVNRTVDALAMLIQQRDQPNFRIGISMGIKGQISRILSPICGGDITYAALEDGLSTAPGQIDLSTLLERYRFRFLNSETTIYGLIGEEEAVKKSISDVTHNRAMGNLKFNSVYIKMGLAKEELTEFFACIRKLPFRGLSVTMPYKEEVIPYLDQIDYDAERIGAVNTLAINDGKISGYNTDGIGALNALEREISVKGKRLIVLGAGGSSKAIVYEAVKRGGQVVILNRDGSKAQAMAERFNCLGGTLDEMKKWSIEGYDILINSTPVEQPIPSDLIRANTVLMDIRTRADDSPMLQFAKENGCRIVLWDQMFFEQALGQFRLWFPGHSITLSHFVGNH